MKGVAGNKSSMFDKLCKPVMTMVLAPRRLKEEMDAGIGSGGKGELRKKKLMQMSESTHLQIYFGAGT